MHYFFWDIKSSIQIVSVDLVSKSSSLLARNSFLVKTIFPPRFLFLSLLKWENWYFFIINWASEKFSSSFVSSFHKILIGAFCNVSCKSKILVLKEFMFRYPITEFFSYVFLDFITISMSSIQLGVLAHFCPLGWALSHFCPGDILGLGVLAHFRLICQTVLIFLNIYNS